MENKLNNIKNNDKISVADYLNNRELLVLKYIPFDSKMEIVSNVINGMVKSIGGLNTTLLRRISTEIFIESITNIDLSIVDENNLKGFDQLCYLGELDNLKTNLGKEYFELEKMLQEMVDDYIRIETNPAVTINLIYKQIQTYLNNMLDYISENIQNIDVDKFIEQLNSYIQKDGEAIEG